MALSVEDILLDNIKEALTLYQSSLVWATTAALSGGLIVLGFRDPNPVTIEILSGKLSGPLAWFIAQVLYLVFGGLALASLRRYGASLKALNPSLEIFNAIQMFPSLATLPGSFFRIGSVLLPLVVTYVSWTIEMIREQRGKPYDLELIWGALLLAVILLMPYAGILGMLKELRRMPLPVSKAIAKTQGA